VQRLGTIERTGAAVMAGFTREVAVWITMMIVAGTAGAAITADLGARKIRDELDALAVLGLDTTRTLVVPRVLAVTLATPILGMFGLLTACLTCYFAMTTLYADSVTGAALAESAWAFAYWQDFVNYALKFIVCGVFIGIVACYKGLTSGGGTEGVGRAVNQSVLITFFGVWFIHTMINIAFFALFPELLVLRG
jgi:phospholipid/cholesterol/gamma-HCH transport system permease protein